MREIQLKHARATLSTVVDHAVRGNPAVITRHGKKAAVVLSFAEYERLSRVPSLGQLLAAFPGEEGDIQPRGKTPGRAVDLETLEAQPVNSRIPLADRLKDISGRLNDKGAVSGRDTTKDEIDDMWGHS